MSERRIVLVRHGRSAHVHEGWLDFEGFLQWRRAYEAAGIDARDTPPPELRELAERASVIITSNVRRAVESAQALAPHKRIVPSSLLHELELTPPRLGRVRLPMIGWALAYGVRMLVRANKHVTLVEIERAMHAAQWLTQFDDELIVVVTHASFRSLLTKALEANGWRRDGPRPRARHWSAWALTYTL